MKREIHQCPACGGFCKKSGCERANVDQRFDVAQQSWADDIKEPIPNKTFNQGIEACMSRLYEMHRITTGRHNFYQHAAPELAKLKEAS